MNFTFKTFATGLVVSLGLTAAAFGHDHGHDHGGHHDIMVGHDDAGAITADLDHHYDLSPVGSESIFTGWSNDNPGFNIHRDEEPDHGVHALPGSISSGDITLHVVELDAGLELWNTDGVPMITEPGESFAFGSDHFHWVFRVTDEDAHGLDDHFDFSFYLSDATGTYADSPTFETEFHIVPEPGSLALLGTAGLMLLRRRRV